MAFPVLCFPDNVFKCIFLNEKLNFDKKKKSLKFLPKGPIDKILALVQIMAWHQIGHKPLSQPMSNLLPFHVPFGQLYYVW